MKKLFIAVIMVSFVLFRGGPAVGAEKIDLSGTLEVDLSWAKNSDIGVTNSTSDLSVSTVELGMEAEITKGITASMVFLAEDIGTPDETGLMVDEAMITIEPEGLPVYIAVGKRAQPFGLFEGHLVADPMTQDAYETSRAGVSVGFKGPMGLDLSATIYKGEEMMNHLFESGLLDTDAGTGVTRTGTEPDALNSLIIAASLAPIEDMLTVFGGYISEPGSGERNTTLNLGLNLVVEGLTVDMEYMQALSREEYDYATGSGEFDESVLSIGAAYRLALKKPIEVAVRYERFDDDGIAAAFTSWSVEDRYSAGAAYTLYEDEASGLSANLGAEYRHTGYRAASGGADGNDELMVKLGVTF